MKGFQVFEWPRLTDLKGFSRGIFVIGLLFLISVVSVEHILVFYKNRSKIQSNLELEGHISRLEASFLESNPDHLEQDLLEVDRLLIKNYTHLTQWTQDMQQRAKEWNLLTQYHIAPTKETASPVRGIKLVPVEMQVTPQGTTESFSGFLKFLKSLTYSGPRVDIHNVMITGNGQQATYLKIGLSVWMKTIDSVER